jgi:hypothetical protein
MQLPLTDPDTLFEELLQDLPSETVQMARACKAFVRAKKVKTPVQLLRVVFCGWDKPWREVAGTFTALYESITDQAVAERLRACGPWVKAMLRQMLPMTAVEPLPTGRRFVVIDASSMQAPGAVPPRRGRQGFPPGNAPARLPAAWSPDHHPAAAPRVPERPL